MSAAGDLVVEDGVEAVVGADGVVFVQVSVLVSRLSGLYAARCATNAPSPPPAGEFDEVVGVSGTRFFPVTAPRCLRLSAIGHRLPATTVGGFSFWPPGGHRARV